MQRLEWTRELVNRFWQGVWQSRLKELSFSRDGGQRVCACVSEYLPPGAKCLDFGAGSGEMVRLLLERGCQVAAYEPSPELQQNLMQSDFSAHPLFRGVVGIESAEQFDVVLMVEVIEHLLEDELATTLARVATFVRPGGVVIVTTPNTEDLDLNSVYCPVSDVFFHRWQHVRSISAEVLCEAMLGVGFHRLHDHRVDFSAAGELYEDHLTLLRERRIMRWIGPFFYLVRPLIPYYLRRRHGGDLRQGSQSNLIYVGRLV